MKDCKDKTRNLSISTIAESQRCENGEVKVSEPQLLANWREIVCIPDDYWGTVLVSIHTSIANSTHEARCEELHHLEASFSFVIFLIPFDVSTRLTIYPMMDLRGSL
jgi:hypothetical protein